MYRRKIFVICCYFSPYLMHGQKIHIVWYSRSVPLLEWWTISLVPLQPYVALTFTHRKLELVCCWNFSENHNKICSTYFPAKMVLLWCLMFIHIVAIFFYNEKSSENLFSERCDRWTSIQPVGITRKLFQLKWKSVKLCGYEPAIARICHSKTYHTWWLNVPFTRVNSIH